jgi:uncharacterized protein
MTAVTEAPPRILTLDIVRGVAVMGILAMNIVAFAMPPEAYMNPLAYGMESGADLASWAFSFILIDGKMRGLFSFLFGASILLVIQKAEGKGESAARVHFSRMLWLLLFGYLHFLLVWYGDILTGYAMIGLIAWFFRHKEPRPLAKWALGFLVIQFALFVAMAIGFSFASAAAAAGDVEMAKQWAEMKKGLAIPTTEGIAETMALYGGSWTNLVHHQLTERWSEPMIVLAFFGWETFGYMLLGMACLKNGFFTGGWTDARYRRTAIAGFAIGIPAYAVLAAVVWYDGFSVPMLVAIVMAATVPFRPVMVIATAALIILLTRRSGPLVARIAAAGRAAFTNYLGTSIVMTFVFYGWGLGWFGSLSRVELWPVVFAMWAVMLLWSKPWLDRFQYGPFEWLWRSLSRGSVQPMRIGSRAAPAAAE